ncbi:o-succinylbenzoate--CoA ligase [Nostocoides vanveenii]|jgi:O-succinylbenzoic acid--CoA ligase|uniref:O-succinylbenzoate--CoA ligase n=1 Tax=Nostocoides vanveenii TaxID=330835 RepID=A0ABP4WU51_9MICO
MLTPLTPVDAADPLALLPHLAAALDGGSPLLPYAGAPPALPASRPESLPADLALVVATSGSTGPPKHALLTAAALRASASATQSVLGGPGQWLLAVPAHHIAGLQVLVRSLLAGTTPVVLERAAGFRPSRFAAATARLEHDQAYVSLVPTQVGRLLDEPSGTAALRRYAAVLVGGAALPQGLRARADAAGVRLVATYGMTETAGGCVYDGAPLPGTTIELDHDGRIGLGGPTLAAGYLDDPQATAAAFSRPGERGAQFRTGDLGIFGADGRLQVLGRRDDVINSGGEKVNPRLVEDAALAACPEFAQVVVVGLPDPEWGEVVALTAVPAGDVTLTLAEVRERLRGVVPAYGLPRRLASVGAIPERGPGKPDRRAVAGAFRRDEVGQ